VKLRQNKLTRIKSSLFVILRKMQLAPSAFLNSLWTFSLVQLQGKVKCSEDECCERLRRKSGAKKIREEAPHLKNIDGK
jgi:hypothetical protein